MLTNIEVCNKALLLVGAQTISTLADATDRARLVNVLYPQARKAVLRAHPWNCAVREVRLTAPGLMSPRDASPALTNGFPADIIGNRVSSSTTISGFFSSFGNVEAQRPYLYTGKYYFEALIERAPATNTAQIGILADVEPVPTWYAWSGLQPGAINTAAGTEAFVYRGTDGQKASAGALTAYGATYTSGDVIGVALDLDAGTLTFYKNGATQGVAYSTLRSAPNRVFYPLIGWANNLQIQILARFLPSEWSYTPPTGHAQWPAKAPSSEWPYAMALPRDWLRTIFCSADQIAIDWKMIGNEIACAEESIDLRYVRDVTDPGLWDAHVTDCVAYYLAKELAYPITKSASQAQVMKDEYARVLRESKTIDGTEETPETPTDYPLIQARRFA